MSLRTPMGRVLGYGSAKEGTDHFWKQRLTAVALVLLGFWFMISLATFGGWSQAALRGWIAMPHNSVLLLLLTVALAWHSKLGVQVIIEDYVHGPFIKVFSLVVSKFAHLVVLTAAVFAILRISFGGGA